MKDHSAPSPDLIMKIGTGFWASKVLLTAVNLDLFTHLASHKSMSAAEIKTEYHFNCTDRHLYDFLDALVSLGFLEKEGNLETALYFNSPDTEAFLDKNKKTYIGGILKMMNNRLYANWSRLEDGLRTGNSQTEFENSSDNLFDELYKDQDRLREFIDAMSGVQMGNFLAFSNSFNFTNFKSLTDAGGSSGLLSIMVATHQPHMTCTSFDLPEVEPIARQTIEKFEVSDRVTTATGNFFNDPIPSADIIVMGNILHDWDEESKRLLIKKAYDALPQGGAFVAIENLIDNERNKNTFGLLMSLNMLLETKTGFDYTFNDFENWASDTGFKKVEFLRLAGPSSAAIAYK
ncbi:Dimerisation domain-containing protein [Zhouia amylolytica]|uniref:Dimerisation domain-containing protein n=1 Tax=Zhouia amylolytica TaxID=376730 RepID=A0A1I6QF32_9FLAO|nr:methyltransferase [Zhouia amylolytica]SFS51067.1 Dimerisation domain-containing protein [Zhouia amylolytica]